MRGLERDELVEKEVFKNRWFNGKLDPSSEANKPPVFLIATSAGEVGFDLNADHMVCDATTIDSLIQRLGRVNRRGDGNAIIQLFVAAPKDGKPIELKGYELAIDNTIKLLQEVSKNHEIDVSPRNIAALKSGRWRGKYAAACSPEPTMVERTDILLDAWSMTSVTTPMPGRPDVAPWLRGIAEWEPPQTTIAWRAELDQPGFEGHVTDVRKRADGIIEALELSPNAPERLALELAADWHDHGKNREFFQRTVGDTRSGGGRPWPNHVMGKSGGVDRAKAPRGYRHEFGSLREFVDAHTVRTRGHPS